MSNSDTEDAKDEQTAKFLHKLAENGKERGIPDCLSAFYEKKAWEASKSDEKYKSCEKCGMPPPPPADFAQKLAPSETCRNCGEVNKKPIGLAAEIKKNEDFVKKSGEKVKSLKRPSKAAKTPIVTPSPKTMPRKIAYTPPPAIIPPPLLLSKSSKKAKKIKIAPEKEPDFLQKLFGIGANPV